MHESRRSFLRVLLGVSALALIYPPRALLSSYGETRPRDPLAVNLANFFRDKESARVVGLEYLRRMPMERDVGLLVERILSYSPDHRTEFAKADIEKCRKILLLQIQKDFEQERVVHVEDWILSQTEARLCALATLV